MSNTINNQIPLTQIIAPSLSDVNYASGLNDVFDNINDNFSTLSNHDFIKGESGTSVKIQEDKFFDEKGLLTVLGQKLQYCIRSLSNNEDEYADVIDGEGNHIKVFDYFEANPGVLYMVYNTVNDVNTQTPVAISSLYYVFLDGRYATTKMGMIDESQYTNIKDFSCVLVYDANIPSEVDGKPVNGGFKALTTAFPTIYYESNVGLCWKVNGNGTGIPVQGIPGRNGLDTNLQIVKGLAPQKTENNQIVSNITQLYGLYDGFIEFDPEEDYSYLHGKAALILAPNKYAPNDNSFYFGMLEVKGNVGEQEIRAYCDQSTSINYSMASETLINVMKDINVVGGDIAHTTLPGLFIPMENREDNSTQKVHLIAATSLTNTKGQTSDLKTDLMYTPISDINNFDVAGSDEENGNQLIVDKYLYVKINENSDFGINNETYSSGSYNTNRRQFKGYLKYKLVNSISSIDSPYMGYFNSNESLENIGGSKIKTDVYYKTLVQNVGTNGSWDSKYIYANEHNSFKIYGVPTNSKNIPIVKSINLRTQNNLQIRTTLDENAYEINIPKSEESINGISQYIVGNTSIIDDKMLLPDSWFVDPDHNTLRSSIYRWVLCDHVDEFDIDELQDNYKYIDGVDNFIDENGKYLFEDDAFKNFAVILTNTMCPTYDSEILWFNSLNVLGVSVTDAVKYIGNGKYEDTKESTIIVAGWQSDIMTFVKFVPVYKNSYAVDVDTSFNINYNVNITGDGNKSTKSLTVHGGINCDDLSVYQLTATGEIKSIYTKDTIVGERGISLGTISINKDDDKNTNETMPALTIDENGVITTHAGVQAKYINCTKPNGNTDNLEVNAEYSVNADNVLSRQTKTNELFIRDFDNTNYVFIGNVGNNNDYKLGFEIKNNEGITIEKTSNEHWLQSISANLGGPGKLNYAKNNDVPIINNDMPILQKGNAPVIVSNQSNDGVQLCYNGVLGWHNSTMQNNAYPGNPGSGVLLHSQANIDEANFDVVKNFNIHRLSLDTKPATIKNTSYDFTAKNNIVNFEHWTGVTYTLSDACGYFTVDGYHNDTYKEKTCIEKLSISKKTDSQKLNLSSASDLKLTQNKNITFDFNYRYGCHIGIHGSCSNGRWPVLHYDGTNIAIRLAYSIDDEDLVCIKHQDFRVNYSTNSLDNGSGYEWTGGDGGYYDWLWRYYKFQFRPNNITLQKTSNSDSDFMKIVNAYNEGKTIHFYVMFEYRLHANGQIAVIKSKGRKSVVAGSQISRPIVLKGNKQAATTQLINAGAGTYSSSDAQSTGSMKINYNVSVSDVNTNEIKSTSLCEDGIVMRAGDYTFGMGYSSCVVDHSVTNGYSQPGAQNTNPDPSWGGSKYKTNIPILFYYKNDSSYYLNGQPNAGNDDTGYARRIHAIPLSDIFGVIKYARTNTNWQFGV